MKKRHKTLLWLACLMGPLTSLCGQHKVLFIGNSFTRGDTPSVPEIFDALAIAGGQENPTTVMRAVDGKRFSWHAQSATTLENINSREWDFVILQNYSTEPTHIGSISNHLLYGEMLYDQVMANHSSTNVILYETWSRSAVHELITDGTFSSTNAMQEELRTNYQLLADRLNTNNPGNPEVVVAPCGTAWENAGALLEPTDANFIKLHGSDEYHGNDAGYYLNAAVFYSVIYGESPEGLHLTPTIQNLSGLYVSDEDLAFLEGVAWSTYQEVMGDFPLQFSTEPTDKSVEEYGSVTFSASARGGERPYQTIQWYLNDEPIPGANELSLTLPSIDISMSGGVYSISVFDGITTITSGGAVLTVLQDTTAPQVETHSVSGDGMEITIEFNEQLSPDSAEDPVNYSVISESTHIPVVSATLAGDGLTLTLVMGAPLYTDYAVEIASAVADFSGNPVDGSASVTGTLPAPSSHTVLIDFGGGSFTAVDGDGMHWNNSDSIARTDDGILGTIVDSTGTTTPYTVEMVRRFTGANTSGTNGSTLFPGTATGDSNYGNTASWSGLTNIFPAFRITGLDAGSTYSLLFYASRMNASDNRETKFTVTGGTVTTTTINPANNVDDYAELTGLKPDAANTILIEIEPGPNNNNTYNFTYLGVLALLAAAPADDLVSFDSVLVVEGELRMEWHGEASLDQASHPAGPWEAVVPAPESAYAWDVQAGAPVFFRLRSR